MTFFRPTLQLWTFFGVQRFSFGLFLESNASALGILESNASALGILEFNASALGIFGVQRFSFGCFLE